MRFSIRINNDLPVAQTIRLAQAAEAAGFDQFWVSNDLFLRSAPTLLAALATHTERIELGSCIFNPYTINPAELAMLAATMDELSGNRFNLGLAAGAADFLGWVGLAHDRPVQALRETILAIRRLLRGERVRFEGHFLQWTDEAYLRFPAPRVTPIYVGAMGPAMLRLTGELADGALPLLFPPEHYETVRPLIAAGEAKRPAELGELDLAACIWVSLAADHAAAREVLAEKIAYYGPSLSPLILERLGLTQVDFGPIEQAMQQDGNTNRALTLVTDQMLQIGVVGDPAALLPRLQGLAAAGAKHLSFGPPLGPDPVAAIALLGEQVLPAFRGYP
ncbi:MAG: LLM class flavin-dependent oxidoreductase, partial [Ardenticatenales bacterium]|nr:LLM class flavin-dependent oxidoreductase [Ardenticatenales bacterium]